MGIFIEQSFCEYKGEFHWDYRTTVFWGFFLIIFPTCSGHLYFYFSSSQSEWELKAAPPQLLHFCRGLSASSATPVFLTNTYK